MAIQLKGNDTSTYSDGATFAGDVNIDRPASIPSSARGIAIAQDGNVTAEINLAGAATFENPVRVNRSVSGNLCFATFTGGTNTPATSAINSDGSASFAGGDLVIDLNGAIQSSFLSSSGGVNVGTGTIGADGGVEKVQIGVGYGQIQIQSALGNNAIYRGYNSDGSTTFTVRGNGNVESTNAYTVQTAAGTQYGVMTYDVGSSTFRLVALNGKNLFCTSSGQTGTIQSGDDWIPFSSERRFKTGITSVDVDDCWNAIKSIQLRNFYYREQEDKTGVPYLGPIVDELETTNPDLVIQFEESKSYNQPLLEMKAIQALQTALTRIEALEAQLTQLTGGAN